jgi:large subunit ribosomal protein L10
MNREEKAAVIDQVTEEIGASEAIFALDYRGITVAQIADVRTKLRDADTKLRVVKNSLSERAADAAGAGDLKPMLVGPTALAMVKGDVAAAAKVLSDAARDLRGPLEFKGGFMDGAVLSSAQVQAIAKLPSRDVLNGQLVGTIAAPLSGFVRTLNALISGLAIQLGKISEEGLVSGTAAPADAPAAAEAAAPLAEEAAEAPSSEAEASTEDGDAAGVSETSSSSAEAEETPEASPTAAAETETEGSSDEPSSDE